MAAHIVHIINHAKNRGGMEQYLHLRASRNSIHDHSLIAINKMEQSYLSPFKHAHCLQGNLNNKRLTNQLNKLNPQVIIIYNNLDLLPELIQYKRSAKAAVLFSAHDYEIFSTGHGYNRLTLKKEISDYRKTGFYIPFKRCQNTRKIIKTTRRNVLSKIENLKLVDAVEVPSASMKHSLQTRFSLPNIHVSKPHAFAFFNHHSDPESKNILFIGGCIKGKGIKFLKDTLLKIDTAFTLTAIGAGDLKEQLTITGSSNYHQVDYHKPVTQKQLTEYYGKAACVVSTSIIESFGMTILEAMSHTRAAVGFNIDGINDQINNGHNGFLAKPFNTTQLAAHISSLIKNYDLRKDLENNAYASSVKDYSDKVIITSFNELLREYGVH